MAGAQKAGTTWLHHTLKKSAQLLAPPTKELDYFLSGAYADRLDDYAAQFPDEPSATYLFESSPNYFRAPRPEHNVAERIAQTLPGVEVILLFRDPIERYESAYIHHTAAGRIPYAPVIEEVRDELGLVALGRYAATLEPWLEHLPQTRCYLYDDLQDKPALVARVMSDLRLDNDIPTRDLDIQVNTAGQKKDLSGWDETPRLSRRIRAELAELYAPDVARLQALIGRDLSHWLKV